MDNRDQTSGFEFLIPFIGEHKAIVKYSVAAAAKILPGGVGFAQPDEPDLDHLSKNVFSILFLAVYASLGIPAERRAFYGFVNHAVRGLVTATDNILDDEDKKILPLLLPPGAARFCSVMNILLYCRMLDDAATRFNAGNPALAAPSGNLHDELLRALFSIGVIEAEEENGLKRTAPPEEIISRVHDRRGGALLTLAFIAPGIYEKDLQAPLSIAREGVYRVGMALQMVDDIVDVAEDYESRKNNYVLSAVARAEGTEGWPKDPPSGPADVGARHPALMGEITALCLKEARQGLKLLNEAGLKLDEPGAVVFLQSLFKIRGASSLLER